MDSPLTFLHDNVLEGLNHLTAHLVFTISTSNFRITNPYAWQWDSILPKPRSLRSLRLRVTFQGCLDVVGASFGAHWSNMNPALLVPGLSSALKRVEVEIRIRAYDTDQIHTRKQDAYAFLAGVRETPCFLQSPCVTQLRREGRCIELVCSSEVKFGPRVRTQID